MANRIELSSEKYMKYSAESKMIRRFKNRIAIRALVAFFIGLALIPVAAYAGEHLHEFFAAADTCVREISGGKYAIPRVELPQITLPKLSIFDA